MQVLIQKIATSDFTDKGMDERMIKMALSAKKISWVTDNPANTNLVSSAVSSLAIIVGTN